MRGRVIAATVLAVLAAAPAALAEKPQPLASHLWAPGYEISYTETVTMLPETSSRRRTAKASRPDRYSVPPAS